MIGHSERFDSITFKLKELLASGIIGKPIMSKIVFEYYPDMTSRPWMAEAKKAGGGVLINSGIHKIDLLRHLFESEIDSVSALMLSSREDFTIEDSAMLNLRFKNNCIAQIFLSFAIKRKPPIWTEQSIYGTGGTIEIKRDKIYSFSESDYNGIKE